jgi:hypothetical protein
MPQLWLRHEWFHKTVGRKPQLWLRVACRNWEKMNRNQCARRTHSQGMHCDLNNKGNPALTAKK